jgi:glutathione S-transferase
VQSVSSVNILAKPTLEGKRMTILRIFSYLPNPRVWKATIAARFCGVTLEIRGASSRELKGWLWDYDAHPLADGDRNPTTARTGRVGLAGATLFKTDAFLEAHPFGNVPAAFGRDGKIGIFESNSIMRVVARLSHSGFPLYGRDPYEASRIDSFLDTSLIFAKDSQTYLLSLLDGSVDEAIQARAREAFAIYASGLEQTLSSGRRTLVGDDISLADICFACELALFMNEHQRMDKLKARGLGKILHQDIEREYPGVMGHFARLLQHEHFKADLEPYVRKLSAAAASEQRDAVRS